MQFVSAFDGGSHERVGGAPHRDEIGERQLSESFAEVVVVDQELRREGVNVHESHFTEEVAEMRTMATIDDENDWGTSG